MGREVLPLQGGHLNEVGDIAFDALLGMVGLLLDFGEGVSLQSAVDVLVLQRVYRQE